MKIINIVVKYILIYHVSSPSPMACTLNVYVHILITNIFFYFLRVKYSMFWVSDDVIVVVCQLIIFNTET